jgi:cytochrome b561
MRSIPSRYRLSFILSHWILAPLILILLELGWYVQSLAAKAPERNIFTDVHISLGLTSVVIVLVLLLLRFFFGGPPLPHTVSPWQRKLIRTIYLWIYVGLVVIALSGLLQAVASAIPIKFWGLPLLAWGVEAPGLINLFWILHGAVAFVLTALVVVHLGLLLLPRYPSSQVPSPQRPSKQAAPPELPKNANPNASPIPEEVATSGLSSKVALKLVRNFRRLGWTAVGVQVVFAFVSGLLLIFAVLGRPVGLHWADLNYSIFLAVVSLILLGLVLIFPCFYPQLAPKLAWEPDSRFNPHKKLIFGLLGMGAALSLVGGVVALAGIVASLSLLLTKAVSHNLLILLVNFNLFVAHVISAAIASRAILLALRARRLIPA